MKIKNNYLLLKRWMNLLFSSILLILTRKLELWIAKATWALDNQQFKSSYVLPFIFNLLGKEISEDAEFIVTYSFKMFILSSIAFSCFMSLVLYFISLFLINRFDIANKYPRLNKVVKYYEKTSYFFITVDIIVCAVILISMIVLNLYLTGLVITNS